MRIGLLNEGTYPYVLGGTSVWCDSMIRGLTEHEFYLVTITSEARERIVWDLPSNVASVRQLAFWGRTRRARRGQATSSARVAIDSMHRAMILGPRDGLALFETSLRALRREQSTAAAVALRSQHSVATLHHQWTQSVAPDLTLRDALSISDIIEHALRPLWEPIDRVDINHAVSNGLAVLPALAALWEYGTPFVLSEHGVYLRERYLGFQQSDYSDSVRRVLLNFYRMLTALGYRHAAAVVPVSSFNRRWAERVGVEIERLSTIYNGVNPDCYPTRGPLSCESAVQEVVWVGRIDPVKDLHTLIRAFAIVRDSRRNVRLRLFGPVGKGCELYAASCSALVLELGLQHDVTFEGRISGSAGAFKTASVTALSSVSEGMPFSVIESMMSGVPVVATDVGGVREAIGNGGLVVAPHDPAAFADALLKVLRDPYAQVRLASNASLRAHDVFRLDIMLSRYRELYASIAGANKRALPSSCNSTSRAVPVDKAVVRELVQQLARTNMQRSHTRSLV